jgi:hypothetical protein
MRLYPYVLMLLVLLACSTGSKETKDANLAEEGFDFKGSDPAAVELADSIMSAMGGRSNWNKTRYISWNFSGRRNLIWDKQSGRVRIESPEDHAVYLINVNNGQGKVQVNGKEIIEKDSLQKLLLAARNIWINDSYWLIMPFKLKDTGVTLKYLGEDTLQTGGKCNVVDLMFTDKGSTSESKYRIYIDITDNLVKEWSYFKKAEQDSATFTRPWDNYKKCGDILLSGDRSDGSGPKNVKVDADLPDKVFTEF